MDFSHFPRRVFALLASASLAAVAAGCQVDTVCVNGECTGEGWEVEPNDTRGAATEIPLTGEPMSGRFGESGDVDFYRFTLTTTSDVRVETFDEGSLDCFGVDTVVELRDADGGLLAEDDDSGKENCSVILPAEQPGARRLPPGTYYAVVSSFFGSDLDSYTIVVKKESSCGDGAVTGSEGCDDGNTANGDGCSSACLPEAKEEVEPNDDVAHATPASFPGEILASIEEGDVDYFTFTLAAPTSIFLETFDATGEDTCNGITDTVVELRTAAGSLVASDDNSGESWCSKMDPQSDPGLHLLPAGTYVVRVEGWSSLDSFEYRLSLY